eukprot:gene692-20262_t
MLDEEDFFENIIKRTENNLINTADFRDGLLTPDVAERAWKYGGALHPKDDRLPMPSTDAADLATVLGAPTNLGEDEWVLGLAKELNVLTSTMRVEDVGEVVTSLPELDFSIRGQGDGGNTLKKDTSDKSQRDLVATECLSMRIFLDVETHVIDDSE